MKILVTTITLILSFLFAATPTLAYTVKQGDTITKIAAENNLTIQEITELNPQIQNLNMIYVGDTVHTKPQKRTSPADVKVNVKVDADLNVVDYSDYKINLLARLVRSEAQSEDELAHINKQIQSLYAADLVKKVSPKKTQIASMEITKYTKHEIDLLARLVRAEAQTEPFEGKIAVACVVLNRVESSQFPDTIKEVIYEPGQFQPVSNGEIDEPADEESIAAVKEALTEKRNIVPESSLFFYNPDIATSRWLDSRATTVVIGQHVFKK
jgi:N-acetylmuramoyl-L-alanine amidase